MNASVCVSAACTGATLPLPDGSPCGGSYVDEAFGVRFAPPPDGGPAQTQDNDAFRLAAWSVSSPSTGPIAASVTYPIAPLETDLMAAVAEVVEIHRSLVVDDLTMTILSDEPLTLDGGNEAHVLTGESADGQIAAVVVVTTGAERFATATLLGPPAALEVMLTSAFSLCVD